MKKLTTAQAARAIAVSRQTLQNWMADKRIKAPKVRLIGGMAIRLWSARDVEMLRKFKEKNYRKGRGRKPRSKK